MDLAKSNGRETMKLSNSRSKNFIGAVLLSAFGFISLPTTSAVMLGVGTTVVMSDMGWAAPNKTPSIGGGPRANAKGIKDNGIKTCGNCGVTGGRQKKIRSGSVRNSDGTTTGR
jgi:hypothetical protein